MADLKEYKTFTWQDEVKTALKNIHQLAQYFDDSLLVSEDFIKLENKYPVFIPQKFAQKIKELGPESSLWKQFIPDTSEDNIHIQSTGHIDPIGDQINYQNNQIIHRYANRVLLMTTPVCPINCRYCFRKNELLSDERNKLFEQKFSQALEYLGEHKEIDEVIFTGGDPLMLSNQNLKNILSQISEIEHIKNIRIHSRMPIIIPSRIDKEFINILSDFSARFDHIILAIHVNHIEEFSAEFEQKVKELVLNKIELLSQTVLLKNVNDSAEALTLLFKSLSRLKIRPYYLHHPDQVLGGMHFMLDKEVGKKIYHTLRKQLSGWEIPHYVIDHPTGKTII